MNTSTATESASIKIKLADIKGLIGLKSISFLLDEKPIKPIALGGTETFSVSPGKHTVQTVLKSRSFITFFITITRKSEILYMNLEPGTLKEVTADYNRTWGNLELQPN